MLVYIIEQFLFFSALMAWEGEPMIAAIIALVSLPAIHWAMHLNRPRLVHLRLVRPNHEGRTVHALRDGQLLITPNPTRLYEHLIRDISPLDIPASRTLWVVFSGMIAVVIALITLLFVSAMSNGAEDPLLFIALPVILISILAIGPAWIIGFSFPALAWLSHMTKKIGIKMRQSDAVSGLVAGMLSTFPAIIINSIIAPEILMAMGINAATTLGEALIVSISAPVGEEICKALAVWMLRDRIHSLRHAFLIGFSVGLGFAMLENLQYIAISMAGGPITFTMTSLFRGVGSIPGHAIWTATSALGIGALLSRQEAHLRRTKIAAEALGIRLKQDESLDEPEQTWMLFDAKTGSAVDIAIDSRIPYEDHDNRGRIPLPTNPILALFIAMCGHALWNGTSISISIIFSQFSIGIQIMAQIAHIILLTGLLLWYLHHLSESVKVMPETWRAERT